MQRVHMAIWSPVTWLHREQLQDDYLFFNTMRQVLSEAGKDYTEVVLSYLRRDREQMDLMLGTKKRIFMFNEFERNTSSADAVQNDESGTLAENS